MRINRNNVDGLLTAIRCATMFNYIDDKSISRCSDCIFGRNHMNWTPCSDYGVLLCRAEITKTVEHDYEKIQRLLQAATMTLSDNNDRMPVFTKLYSEYELIEKRINENKQK